jgi:MEDS: MEthanogen/methylotroph, DcmR Sensory domain
LRTPDAALASLPARTMQHQHRTITIADRPLQGIRHICCFYDSEDQLESVFLPYLSEGLRAGEKVVCIFPLGQHGNLRAQLERRGSNIAAAEADDQFKLLTEDETYIAGGLFAKDRMAEMLKDVLEEARHGSRPHVRTLGEMSWALRNLPGTDDLAEYESVVNDLCTEYDCTLACAYDINAFHGRVLADALATHSHIVLNGVIHENPHYMPPREFRRFIAKRRSGPGPVRAGADS